MLATVHAQDEERSWQTITRPDKTALARFLDKIVRSGLPSLAKYSNAESCSIFVPLPLIDMVRHALPLLVTLPQCFGPASDTSELSRILASV